MSFKKQWFFVVKGKPELRSELEQSGAEELVSLLYDPVIWIYETRGRNSERSEDWFNKIRVMFLANIGWLYLGKVTKPELGMVVRQLLGPKPVDIKVFDKWWTIERLDEEYISDAEDEAELEELDMFGTTGISQIDEWLEGLKAKKRAQPGS